MAQITDLNVSPYYDDFDKNDNFQKVLFRPGFAVQARELTTLQSILQDQIEAQGSFIFKEGSVVIPGQVSFQKEYSRLLWRVARVAAATLFSSTGILREFKSPISRAGSQRVAAATLCDPRFLKWNIDLNCP